MTPWKVKWLLVGITITEWGDRSTAVSGGHARRDHNLGCRTKQDALLCNGRVSWQIVEDIVSAKIFEDLYSDPNLTIAAGDVLDANHFPLTGKFHVPHWGIQVQSEFNVRTDFLLALHDDKHASGTDVAREPRLLID